MLERCALRDDRRRFRPHGAIPASPLAQSPFTQLAVQKFVSETPCGDPVDSIVAKDGTLLITTRVSRSVGGQIPLQDVYENYRKILAHPFLLVPPAGAAENQ